MAKQTLGAFLERIERSVPANGGSRYQLFSACGVLLSIWSGGIPDPEYDPRYRDNLKPLYNAWRKFGRALHTEISTRSIAAWHAEHPAEAA